MSKMTPGPWEQMTLTTKAGRDKVSIRGKGRRLFDMNVLDDEDAANATAIAALPDLIEALKAHDEYMSKHHPAGPDSTALHPDAAANWKRVRTALRKAGVS